MSATVTARAVTAAWDLSAVEGAAPDLDVAGKPTASTVVLDWITIGLHRFLKILLLFLD